MESSSKIITNLLQSFFTSGQYYKFSQQWRPSPGGEEPIDGVHPERILRVGRQCALLNPRLCAVFYSVERVGGGGSVGPPPNRSASDGLRASRKKKRAYCTRREAADGTQI